MQRIIYQIGIIFAVAVLYCACSDDFLDKQPTGSLSAETFYKSKKDFEMSLTACYATLQNHELTWSIPFIDCLTDNGYSDYDYFSVKTISQGPITPTSAGINRVYNTQYSNIARYNVFLQQLAPYSGTDMSATVKATYEAEVRLLRAIAYSELYKYYGEVPLVLEPLTYETQDQPKVSMDKIFAQIIDDVDFAIGNLPDVSFANNSGHFVKSAAQLVKARAIIYDAYNDDGSAKQESMTQVKQLTGEIMKTGYYQIANSYRGLFCDDLGEQANNPEYVFSVNFLAPLNNALSHFGWGVFNNYIGTAVLGGGIDPYNNFVAEYDFTDGTPFSVSNPLYDPDDVFKNRDPRMAKTMFIGTVTFEKGYQYKPMGASLTDYYFWKIISEDEARAPNSNSYNSNWPKMRYAEVLLMYAEAANEVDGPTNEVYDALNQIRSRSDILMPDLPAGYTKEQMRSKIRQERRIELSFEGFRYDDLKRWKIAVEKLNFPASEGIVPHSFEKKNYHWPIPQDQIDKSNGILVQNPDYL